MYGIVMLSCHTRTGQIFVMFVIRNVLVKVLGHFAGSLWRKGNICILCHSVRSPLHFFFLNLRMHYVLIASFLIF